MEDNKKEECKELQQLKKLRSAIDGMIEVMEKENPTEEEVELATGKFMIAIMAIEAMK